MERQEHVEIARLAEAASHVVASLLEQPHALVKKADLELLAEFSMRAGNVPQLKVVGEKARSLVTLLLDRSEQFLDDQIYVQLLAIAQSLDESMHAAGHEAGDVPLSPLITPITRSEARQSNQIAVLTDNPLLLNRLTQVAHQAGFSLARLGDLHDISAIDENTCPAAIIAELSLFQLNPSATTELRRLHHRLLQPPHLFLLGMPDDISARLDAVRLGATRFISTQFDVSRLVAVLKGVTLRIAPKPYRVMLIDDDRLSAKAHELALRKAGMETLTINNPLLAPIQIGSFQPDVIVSDIFMQGCNGLELLAVIRQDDSLSDTPVIILSSETDPRRHIEALDLGGDGFLCKPVALPLLVSTVQAHAKRSRRLKRTRKDVHDFFNQMRNGEFSADNPVTETRILELQGELLPPNLIPPEDYVVHDAGQSGTGTSR